MKNLSLAATIAALAFGQDPTVSRYYGRGYDTSRLSVEREVPTIKPKFSRGGQRKRVKKAR